MYVSRPSDPDFCCSRWSLTERWISSPDDRPLLPLGSNTGVDELLCLAECRGVGSFESTMSSVKSDSPPDVDMAWRLANVTRSASARGCRVGRPPSSVLSSTGEDRDVSSSKFDVFFVCPEGSWACEKRWIMPPLSSISIVRTLADGKRCSEEFSRMYGRCLLSASFTVRFCRITPGPLPFSSPWALRDARFWLACWPSRL